MQEIFETKTDVFFKNAEAKTRYVFNQGGTGSSKTYSLLELIFIIALKNQGCVISCVSESLPHCKRGMIRDFKNILITNLVWQQENFNKTENEYYLGKSTIEFFGADADGKVHGARRDYLFVNEIQNIKYETFHQLAVRTRKRIYADYNPTSEFWAHEKFINNPDYGDKITFIHSTYKDNPYLEKDIVNDILARAKRDENFRRVYIEGLPGVIEGLIYPKFQMIDSFPENADIFRGMDFGYSNAPTTLVKIAKMGYDLFIDEEIYSKGLRNSDIARLIIENKYNTSTIWADSEDPKSIDELKSYGIDIHGAEKPKGSVEFGIQLIKQLNIHVTKRSVNIIKELRNYKWQTDKDGTTINKPAKVFDHAMDAMRYGVYMEYGRFTDNEWECW